MYVPDFVAETDTVIYLVETKADNEISDADWDLILPYLEENEKLFAISIDRLLTVDNQKKSPKEVYRKIMPHR